MNKDIFESQWKQIRGEAKLKMKTKPVPAK